MGIQYTYLHTAQEISMVHNLKERKCFFIVEATLYIRDLDFQATAVSAKFVMAVSSRCFLNDFALGLEKNRAFFHSIPLAH